MFGLLSSALILPVLWGPIPSNISSSGWLLLAILGLCRWPQLRLPAVLLVLALQVSQKIHNQLEARYLGPPRNLCALLQIETITARRRLPRPIVAGKETPAAAYQLRFEARVLAPATTLDQDWQGRRLRLLIRSPGNHILQSLAPGRTLWLRLRVRAPSGRRNPAGFDYERWLFSKRISAVGTVDGGWAAGDDEPGPLARLRDRARRLLTTHPSGVWLAALLLGDRSGLQAADWDLLRATGTVHLLVVSGLHVSMIAGVGLLIGLGLGRCLALVMPDIDARLPALLIAAAASAGYVALSGSGVPAQRAWIMTNLALGCWALGRVPAAFPALLLALFLVLLVDPLAALGSGLWLSFGAVGLLLFWFQTRRRRSGMLVGFLEAQLLVTLGLQPLLSATGAPLALAAPAANLVAVPLVSWIVLPFGLLALLFSLLAVPGSGALLALLSDLLKLLLQLLQSLSNLPQVHLPTGAALATSIALIVVLLLFRPLRCLHWAALGLVLTLSLFPTARIASGEFSLVVLDAGQGDAVLVATRQHTLLFDTGGAYLGESLLAEPTILPVLRQRQRFRLDALVVSHDDLDHAGGEAVLRKVLSPRLHYRSKIATEHPGAAACRRGVRWRWDQVQFEFLHPVRSTAQDGRNEQSCVLLIRNESGTAQALLPGDIDTVAERQLRLPLARETVALMPHHGSRTSSSPVFVRRLRARFAIASAARFSRFGHPHPDVLRRYLSVGSEVVVTGTEGALEWRSDKPRLLQRQRCLGPYWGRSGDEHCD